MGKQLMRIPFEEFAVNLASLFDAVAEKRQALLVEREGQVFQLKIKPLHKPEDIWADYDPRQARAALRKSAGALSGINREQLITDIHAARQQNSLGRPA